MGVKHVILMVHVNLVTMDSMKIMEAVCNVIILNVVLVLDQLLLVIFLVKVDVLSVISQENVLYALLENI